MEQEDDKKKVIDSFGTSQHDMEQASTVTTSEKSVFELDGTDFRPNKEASKLIVKNDAIRSFIIARKHAPNCILVGPKGSGKSLLLRLRSWSYLREADPLNLSDGDDFSI